MALPKGYEDTEAKLDAALADLVTALGAKQAAYVTSRGRYWQGLRTPTTIPVDGDKGDLDATLKPAYQAESWATLNLGLALPAKLEGAVQVDAYDGPHGKGYVVAALVKIGEQVFRRTHAVGAETRRTQPWREVRAMAVTARSPGGIAK